jgi:hypothetical protein
MILIENSRFIMKIYKKLKHSFYMKIVTMNVILYKIYMILIHNSRFIMKIYEKLKHSFYMKIVTMNAV